MSIGIDTYINNLVEELDTLWSSNTKEFNGRVYRNLKENGRVSPQIFNDTYKKYVEVLGEDTIDAQCFFDLQPKSNSVGFKMYESDLRLVFMVNVDELCPGTDRLEAIEQIIQDIESIIGNSEFEVSGLVRGYDAIKDYDWENFESVARANMHPYYCFRFELKLIYQNLNC